LSVTIGLITVGLIGFVGFQRYGALSKLVHAIRLLRIGQGRFLRFSEHLLALDTQLVAYYKRYPWRFGLSLFLHVVAYAFEMVKTYILLRLLLGVDAPTFAEAAMVAVAVSALDEMFFFVPGRLGTLEGARFLVLSTLGVAQVYGLAFGLIARAEHVIWNGLGFVAYAVCTRFPTGATVGQEAQGCALRSEGARQG
jgi:hypothetical protein